MTRTTKVILLIGLVWVIYIGYAYIAAFRYAKPFDTYLDGECPQINIHVLPSQLTSATIFRKEYVELIAWFDKKTGQEIAITDDTFRRYQSTLNCTKQRFLAFVKRESAKQGLIQPELRIKYGFMAAIMFLPPLVAVVLIALPLSLIRRRT